MAKQRIEVVCPCCQAKLIVDGKSGLILHSEVKKSAFSFEEALEMQRDKKAKSDELFQKAFSDEQKRQDTLEEKFQEALRSKDELDEPPPRPWELD